MTGACTAIMKKKNFLTSGKGRGEGTQCIKKEESTKNEGGPWGITITGKKIQEWGPREKKGRCGAGAMWQKERATKNVGPKQRGNGKTLAVHVKKRERPKAG